MKVTGLLLAAGAGRRMGTPKALLRDSDGNPFLNKAIAALRNGGCESVTVVLGASADEARAMLPPSSPCMRVVVAADWDAGMGASLCAGLAALEGTDASCAVVTLVDLPDVGGSVVRRVLREAGGAASVLARAEYAGVPGHPVLLGRDHWAGVAGSAHGDQGARDYLTAHEPMLVECGDLATGRDVDRPDEL